MSIHALTALARSAHVRSMLPTILDGRIAEAASIGEGMLETRRSAASGEANAEVAMLCADLMLAQDREQEAEDLYRVAVRAAANAPRGQVRVMSCRSIGMTSLYRQRLGTAAECFRRLAEDSAATIAQRVEALGGLAFACHGMGHTAQAMQALDDAAELATEAPTQADAAPLVVLTSMLRVELLVRQEIRSHSALRDHVFWQSLSGSAAHAQMGALAAITVCLEAHGYHKLHAQRLRHQRALLLACCGDAAAARSLHDHLAQMRQSGMLAYERQARLETALVAIVIRDADMARRVLEPFTSRRTNDALRQRWNVELSYCLAKLGELDGRSEDSFKHYQRYALESIQCLRVEALAEANRGLRPASDVGAVKDAAEMGLPAKYRRAYRYLIENLDAPELSIRQIAEHIGVTERAMQMAFRSHLGMTPAEVLRRCRVERIRDDLLKGDSGGQTVVETAARWGIRNRATLAASYRRYFDETPTQTLSRQGKSGVA